MTTTPLSPLTNLLPTHSAPSKPRSGISESKRLRLYYLASAYSFDIKRGYWNAVAATGLLTRLGYLIYSPIISFHEVAAQHSLPTDAGFWWRINEGMLEKVDGLIVLAEGPFEESTGVGAERAWWRVHRERVMIPSPKEVLVTLNELEVACENL